jgi:hypothetical protein
MRGAITPLIPCDFLACMRTPLPFLKEGVYFKQECLIVERKEGHILKFFKITQILKFDLSILNQYNTGEILK